MKKTLKQKAIKLRRSGLSYSEIKETIPVAKSTLSFWLRDIELDASHLTALKKKQFASAQKGAIGQRVKRIEKTQHIIDKSRQEVALLSRRDLFMIGVSLYWAEGAKQKPHNVSQRVCFANSDSHMLKIFLLWLDKICSVRFDDLVFELYIHETASYKDALIYWREELGIPENKNIAVRFKHNKIGTERKNLFESYHGLLRVTVIKSTDLNRKISGWISALT